MVNGNDDGVSAVSAGNGRWDLEVVEGSSEAQSLIFQPRIEMRLEGHSSGSPWRKATRIDERSKMKSETGTQNRF